MSRKKQWEPLADQMAIANAPRLEIVLSPGGATGQEGTEISASTLCEPYLIIYHLDGSAANVQLDGGPFTQEEGQNFILAVCTTIGEKYGAPGAMRDATPSSEFDAKFRKH
jgi:hypothetical protein